MRYTTLQVKLLLFITVSLTACNSRNETKEPENHVFTLPVKVAEVEVVIANKNPFNSEIVSNGKLMALNKADIPFTTSENIIKIRVKNGSHIRKGETIAVVQNFTLKNKLQLSRIQFEKAKTLFYDVLIGQGYNYNALKLIPQDALEAAKIKSGYAAAENELKLMEYNYKQSFIIAPISGVIANLSIKENNYSHAGDILCSVIGDDHFEVLFPIMESELSMINKNDRIIVYPYFKEAFKREGYVSEINPIIDKSGLVSVKAIISNKDHKFYEGMNVKVFMKLPGSNKISVPKNAVVMRSGKPVVFTLKKGIANWNYVKTGSENNNSVVIEEGLINGDTIIFKGNINLAHNSSVKVLKSPVEN